MQLSSAPTESNCWLWLGPLNNGGYSYVNWRYYGKRIANAHVGSWMAYNEAEIPEGLEVHHICEVRACVNPEHLDVVTHRENLQMRNGGSTEYCQWGHPRSEDNEYYHTTKAGLVLTSCRQCQLDKGQREGNPRASRAKY